MDTYSSPLDPLDFRHCHLHNASIRAVVVVNRVSIKMSGDKDKELLSQSHDTHHRQCQDIGSSRCPPQVARRGWVYSDSANNPIEITIQWRTGRFYSCNGGKNREEDSAEEWNGLDKG